jgi:diguanylate cyclase (GGDEF)-like protein
MHIMSFYPLNLGGQTDDRETAKVLDVLGSLVAKTIDAKLDGLTALPVRKYFDRSLDEHIARFASEGRNFSLISLDLDHFKDINDKHGHSAGDLVLAALARILHNGVRARSECTDTVFRTGGEEFSIILSDVSRDEAARIAERLRNAIKVHDFGMPVTCSFGVADILEVPGETPGAAIYKLADDRLYIAKSTGRDSVVSYDKGSHVRMKAVQMPDVDKAGNQ